MKRYLALLTAAALCCAPGLARDQATQTSAAKPAKPKIDDPARKVCEKIMIPGSRADIRRVCATPAEWADMRRRDREWTEAIQRGVCVPGAGC